MNDAEINIILHKAFGADLDTDVLDMLCEAAVQRTYPKGASLCRQGEIGDEMFILVSGQVVVMQKRPQEPERTLDVLKSGRFFGEMALIDNSPRMATCTAVTDVVVLEITQKVFDYLVEHSPILAYTILRRILFHMRRQDSLAIADLETKNAELARAYADLQTAQAELIVKERLQHELELAADVQRRLLPMRLPQYPDYSFAAYLEPARHVGGDFYDVYDLDDTHVGILIADVADKGVHASLFMAVTRTLFHQEAQRSLSPAIVAQNVHAGMLAVAPTLDVFVTAFYGVLHRPSGMLTYVRAAHERPLLAYQDGRVENLPGDGRFLGMVPDLSLSEHVFQLQSRNRLLLFSDGLVDAANTDNKRYGLARLESALCSGRTLSASQLVAHMVADVEHFVQGAPQFDDLTLLAVEVCEQAL